MLKKIIVGMVAIAVVAIAGRVIANDRHEQRGRKWAATWTTAPVNTFKGSGTTQTNALVNFAYVLTTKIQPQYATHSDPTGTPDWLHLGRAGAQAEADQLDIGFFRPTRSRR